MSTKVSIKFPVLSILGLIFVTLKLTNYITWSWWWVLAPFWMPIAIVVIIAGILGIGIAINESRSK